MTTLSPTAAAEFSPELFADAFPFHIVFDETLTVRQVGRSIPKILPELMPGVNLTQVLRIEYPNVAAEFHLLVSNRDLLFVLSAKDGQVRLRGEMVPMPDQKLAVLLASPWLTDPSDLQRLNLTFSDFARHDPVVDILQIIQTQRMALNDLRKLTERLTAQRAELHKANAALLSEISERKRVEADLREREARFHTLLESASEAVVIADAHGAIVLANTRAEMMFGYERAALTGQPVEILLPLGLRDVHVHHRTAYVEHPHTRPMGGGLTLAGRHRSGAAIPLEISLSYVNTNDGILVMAFLTDITERQRSAEQIRSQRDFAQQIMGTMGQGLTVTNIDLAYEYVNPAFAAMFGAAPEDLIGHSPLELVRPEDRARLAAVYVAPDAERGSEVEAHLVGADGKEIPVLLTCVAWQREGEPSSTITVVTNLSERKQIEQATVWARDRALEASRLKSDFLASVSHEIRTPLNSIIGVAELLEGTTLDREQGELVSLIEESGKVLLALINDILDFSKIEAGKLVLESHPFNLRSVVEAALGVVRTAAARKGIQLAYALETPTPATVRGDENRLSQVLINLLGNAVKFTERGAVTVTVTAYRTASVDGRAEVQFSVHDSGIGIPPDRQDRLFHAFSQVDASTSRRYGGTGLGLAISSRLCTAMGGRMWVESSGIPGQGSTFHFGIPFPVDDWETDAAGDAILAGKRLLMVRSASLNAVESRHVALLACGWGMDVQELDSMAAAADWIGQGGSVHAAVIDESDMPPVTQSWPPLLVLLTLGNRPTHDDPHITYLTKPTKAAALQAGLRHAITLGVAGAEQRPVAAAKAEAAVATAPLRILVVEDTPVNQVVIRRMLDRLGYTADLATSGLEALAAVQERLYDLILMDMQMPDMDGLEATRQIRAFEDGQALRVRAHIVALTANASPEDRSACFDAGMDGFLSKPLRIGELREMLEQTAQIFAAAGERMRG